MADPLLVEVGLGVGDWANISDRVYDRSEISIIHGLQSEDGTAGPAAANLALKNDDNLFAVRNPSSPLYGLMGRNSPLRISYGRGAYGLVLSRAGNGRAQLLDNAAISLTGDIDVRIDLELLGPEIVGADPVDPARWKWPTAGFDLASKSAFFVGTIGWGWTLIGGAPQFKWSANGTNVLTAGATASLTGSDTGRRVLRVTIDVDNGASGRTITFYEGSSMSGPWTMIGTPKVQAGVTSIFDNTRPLTVGAFNENSSFGWGGTGPVSVYGFELRNGINGTVVASSNYTALPLDSNPFTSAAWNDAQGNSWLPQGSADAARIWYGNVDVRFVGELASLPNRFSIGLHDRWVPVTANGVLRRYGQGNAPTSSGLRDFTLAHPDPLVTYFPLDGAEGTLYSVNLGNTYYLGTRFYPYQFAINKYGIDLKGAIGSVMELNATAPVPDSYMRGDVGTARPNLAFDFVFQSNLFGVLQFEVQDYNVRLWSVTMNDASNGCTIQVSFIDPDTGPVGFSPTGVIPELRDNAIHHCRLQISTSGSDTNWALYIDGTLRDTGSTAGYKIYGASLFRMRYTRYVNQTVVNIGHLTMWGSNSAASIPSAADCAEAAFGYAGDTAADRMTRVASDGGIPLEIVGDPAETMPMGVLFAEPRLAQIRDAESADMGILHESRSELKLQYRTRRSMTGQTPALTLAFDGGQVKDPLEPVDDDQLTRNDVTASRRDGGSSRHTIETGRLSIQDPPFGAGLYDDEVTVNVQNDALLKGVAAWVANQGTLDKARYPTATVELAAPDMDPDTIAAVYAARIGDLMAITGTGSIGEYDGIDMIIVGYAETIGQETGDGKRISSFTFVGRPADLYRASLYGTARYDTGGSSLASAVNATATSLSLATVAGQALWTTDPAAFPLDLNIAGERVTVSAITGSASPQTAAVTRSVNGVVKVQKVGATVRLADTPRYTL